MTPRHDQPAHHDNQAAPAGADQLRLTAVEQALVDHVTAGDQLDLTPDTDDIDETTMRAWNETHTIRAHVLRDILRGRLAPDPDPHGLQLRAARITGRLDLKNLTTTVPLELANCLLTEGIDATDATLPNLRLAGCHLEHPSEPALDAARLKMTANLDLTRTRITTDSEPAAIQLSGGHIGGQMDYSGATLHNDTGPALHADGLQVDQDMFLREGFSATGAGELGTLRLLGARVGGQLDCSGATLRNDTGPALHADGLQVDEGMFLREGFSATGAGELGTLRLPGARVGGQLECSGATLHNDTGPALDAEGLQVGQGMFLREGFSATGAGELGTLWLLGASVGLLDCSGATLRNDTGPALSADRLQVGQGMFLREGFSATGAGELGTLRLPGARVGGQLSCSGATLRNDTGPALDAERLRVDQNIFLGGGFTAAGGGEGVTVNLRDARVGGTVVFDPQPRVRHLQSALKRLAVDGLTYTGLPGGIRASDWLRLLREGTPTYAAQPYQHLAAAHRAAGHDREARQVLIRQRQDQIRYTLGSRAERVWARLTGLTLGYGYQPWRALLALLLIAVAAVTLAIQLGAHGGLAHTSRATTPGQPCDRIERVGVGIDLGIPLIKTGARDRCDLTTNSTTAQALTVTGWSLQLLAWAFATLFIAGFTSAVRKT